jgi:hypothetical protein
MTKNFNTILQNTESSKLILPFSNPNMKNIYFHWFRGRVIVFNVTFNNISDISRRSVLLMEEGGVLGENDQPCASMLVEEVTT